MLGDIVMSYNLSDNQKEHFSRQAKFKKGQFNMRCLGVVDSYKTASESVDRRVQALK